MKQNDNYMAGLKEVESVIKIDGLATAYSNLEYLINMGFEDDKVGSEYIKGYTAGIGYYKILIETQTDF